MDIEFANKKLQELLKRGIDLSVNQPLIVNNRLISSMRGAKTRFINHEFIEHRLVIPEYFLDNNITEYNIADLMSALELEITELIQIIINNQNTITNQLLKLLALKISFWGGKTSLMGIKNEQIVGHYLIEKDFNWENYHNLIILVQKIDFNHPDFTEIFNIKNKFNHLGLSFLTKHLHFITSHSTGCCQLPIYDSIIADKWFNTKVKESDYSTYFNWIREKAQQLNIDNHSVERILFNHCD